MDISLLANQSHLALTMIVERKSRCETEWAKQEQQRHLAAVVATTAAATATKNK